MDIVLNEVAQHLRPQWAYANAATVEAASQLVYAKSRLDENTMAYGPLGTGILPGTGQVSSRGIDGVHRDVVGAAIQTKWRIGFRRKSKGRRRRARAH